MLAQQSNSNELQNAINLLMQQQKISKKDTNLAQQTKTVKQLSADDYDKCDKDNQLVQQQA